MEVAVEKYSAWLPHNILSTAEVCSPNIYVLQVHESHGPFFSPAQQWKPLEMCWDNAYFSSSLERWTLVQDRRTEKSCTGVKTRLRLTQPIRLLQSIEWYRNHQRGNLQSNVCIHSSQGQRRIPHYRSYIDQSVFTNSRDSSRQLTRNGLVI